MSSEIIFSILVIGSIPIAFFICWTIYSLEDMSDSNYDKEIMENWNYFKWIAYGMASIWGLVKATYKIRPKSGIDKEIAEEEKEIAELESQKEKMDRLEELKRRKERLFHDVRDAPKREELNSDIAVSFSGNKNRLDVEFISGWHKVYYSHAYNLDEIKQAIYDEKPIIEEDVRL